MFNLLANVLLQIDLQRYKKTNRTFIYYIWTLKQIGYLNDNEDFFEHQLNSLEFSETIIISDEFELKFPELSQAELKNFRAELSRAGHFNF